MFIEYFLISVLQNIIIFITVGEWILTFFFFLILIVLHFSWKIIETMTDRKENKTLQFGMYGKETFLNKQLNVLNKPEGFYTQNNLIRSTSSFTRFSIW